MRVAGEHSFPFATALVAGLLVIPAPYNPCFGPFRSSTHADEFLRTMWQVEAGALALSLTVIVFAVQSYAAAVRGRYGASLRRFIRASRLEVIYQLGVLALVTDGAVLVGYGHDGTAGWAGLCATGLSLLSVALLPGTLTNALRSAENDMVRRLRQAALTEAVRDQVRREARQVLAASALDDVVANSTERSP
jgi:hypothetical protein